MVQSGREQTDNDLVQSIVSGGWNTSDSALSIPPSDSPDLLNVDIETDGTVSKRRGITSFQGTNVPSNLIQIFPVKLKIGYNIILSKLASGELRINYYDGDASTATNDIFRIIQYVNVFANPEGSYHDCVVSSEPLYTRILLFQENHIPIQVTIVERTQFVTGAGTTTISNVDVGSIWSNAVFGEMFAWVDGVFNQPTGFAYAGSTSSLVVTDSVSAAVHKLDMVWISWQWWTESLTVGADQIIGEVTQGTTEKHKEIPTKILRDVEQTAYGVYPIKVMSSTNFDAQFTRVANLTPTTNTEYTFSLGTENNAQPHVPSPFFVSFGAVPGAARPILYHRGYQPRFKGGRGVTGAQSRVQTVTNTTSWSQSTTVPPSEGGAGAGVARFGWFGRDTTYGVLNSSASLVKYYSFDATSTATGGIGIPYEDRVVVSVSDPAAYSNNLGSSALSTTNPLTIKSKSAWSVHGIQDFADYNLSFPGTGAIVQRRLALAGFPDAPLTISFSEIEDTTIPGRFYANLQTILQTGLVTDGFYVTLSSDKNDQITCLREFQGNLFVFTRYKVFRISAIQGQPFADGSVSIDTVASIGCFNNRSAVVTSNSIYWLSPLGVYGLLPTDTAEGYTVREVSLKIRNHIQDVLNPLAEQAAWIAFDQIESRLYCGLLSKRLSPYTASTQLYGSIPVLTDLLFVFHENRAAWTRYSDSGGLKFITRGIVTEYENAAVCNLYLCGYMANDAVATVSGIIHRMKYEYPVDVQYPNLSGSTGYANLVAGTTQGRTFTTEFGRFTYDPTDYNTETEARKAIKLSSILSLQDCIVKYGATSGTTNELVFGVDYIKTIDGTIQLLFNPTTGFILQIYAAQRWNGSFYYPYQVIVNGVIVDPNDASITSVLPESLTNNLEVTLTGLLVTDVVVVGECYPAYIYSPIFTRNSLQNWKRLKYFTGYYDNTVLGERWLSSEVPTGRFDLVGLTKNHFNFDLIMLYNNEQDGSLSEEVYGASSLSWDEAVLGLGVLSSSYKRYSRIVVPVIGGGYDFQFVHYSSSVNTFRVAGYQIQARVKPGKGVSRA